MSCKVLFKVGEDLFSKTFDNDQDAMTLYYSLASGAEQSEEGVKDTFESITITDVDQGLKEIKIDLNKISWVGMQEIGGQESAAAPTGDTVEGGGEVSTAEGPTG